MKLEVLLGGLENPQPAVRLDVVRVLGMLDETRALERLRARYESEPDPTVRNAIAWAGKRLFQAQQANYSTVDEIFRYFNIDKEIENTPDAAELEVMRKMEDTLQQELIDIKQKGTRGRVGWAIGTALVGGAGAGAAAMMMAAMPGGSASSSMGNRPQIGLTRTPATAPSDVDINIWLKRLREGESEDRREQAAIQLADLNNPRALPHLAATFVSDPSPRVRQAAQKFGKVLYWRAIYWEMEQNGTLAEEMVRRAAVIGKQIKPNTLGPAPGTMPPPGAAAEQTGQPAAPPQSDVDVSEILRKAQENRSRRKPSEGRHRSRGRRK